MRGLCSAVPTRSRLAAWARRNAFCAKDVRPRPPLPTLRALFCDIVSRRSGKRRHDHLVDTRRAGREHDQAIEAHGAAARRRHAAERGDELLVDRIAFAVKPFLLGHLLFEAAPLLDWIGQFAKTVG